MTGFDALRDRIAESIGVVHRSELGQVRADDFQRFAYACNDLDARYLDDEYARSQNLPGCIAPPMFVSAVMQWGPGPAEDALRPDGTVLDATASLPLDGLRLMGAGQDIEFHSDVVDGDILHAEVDVASVRLKEGRSGDMLIIEIRRRYFHADDSPVATCLETVIAR